MSVEIEAIRQGLATNLRTVADSRQVTAHRTSLTPPSLAVTAVEKIERNAFGKNSYTVTMLVQGVAARSTDKGAEVRAEKWMSPTGALSVWKAIESDTTLGGIVSNTIVTECDGLQTFVLDGGNDGVGSTWHVQIIL